MIISRVSTPSEHTDWNGMWRNRYFASDGTSDWGSGTWPSRSQAEDIAARWLMRHQIETAFDEGPVWVSAVALPWTGGDE